jgi:hypothetical protein
MLDHRLHTCFSLFDLPNIQRHFTSISCFFAIERRAAEATHNSYKLSHLFWDPCWPDFQPHPPLQCQRHRASRRSFDSLHSFPSSALVLVLSPAVAVVPLVGRQSTFADLQTWNGRRVASGGAGGDDRRYCRLHSHPYRRRKRSSNFELLVFD